MPYEGNTMQARAPPTSGQMYRARPLCRSTAAAPSIAGIRDPASHLPSSFASPCVSRDPEPAAARSVARAPASRFVIP